MAVEHKTSASWRITGKGNRWQVQTCVSDEHGHGWLDIGHPRKTLEEAEQLMYTRQPKSP